MTKCVCNYTNWRISTSLISISRTLPSVFSASCNVMWGWMPLAVWQAGDGVSSHVIWLVLSSSRAKISMLLGKVIRVMSPTSASASLLILACGWACLTYANVCPSWMPVMLWGVMTQAWTMGAASRARVNKILGNMVLSVHNRQPERRGGGFRRKVA